MKKKLKTTRKGKGGTVEVDRIIEAPDDATDQEIIDFFTGRIPGTHSIPGAANPNDDPDNILGRNKDGDLVITDDNGVT